MRSGVRIGVDVGSVRIGVARSDATGMMAVPVVTVKRGPGDIREIVALVAEYEAIEVLVGLPRSLNGNEGPAAQIARDFAEKLAECVDEIAVRLVDERLSTTQAHRDLRDSGKTTRQSRSIVDQAAAVIIVQQALDAERNSGLPHGITVGTV